MTERHLANSTHNQHIDKILLGIVGIFEIAFPERIRSYYIEGSFADSSEVATSDIDLQIIFRGSFTGDEERAQAEELAGHCTALCSAELDIGIDDEESFKPGAWPTLKWGSLLVYGEDIRGGLTVLPLAQWARDRMHSSYWRTVKLFDRPEVVTYPLGYPDPAGQFYGYDRRKIRLADGREVNCTRDLIRLVGWSATGMIAFRAGRYVARKKDCHVVYQECFDDEWGQLLQDIYELCRGRWQYLIPDNEQERELLRDICRRTLGFENYFLRVYKQFVMAELRSGDEQAVNTALWVLGHFELRDEEVKRAVQEVAG